MIRVAYIGGQVIPPTSVVWGGSIATNYAYQKAFENDAEFCIDMLPRTECHSPQAITRFCHGADIVHLDDTGICSMMFEAGMQPPDIIGPITRSAIKNYKNWTCPYQADWFYSAKVIRLNKQEERKNPELYTLVTHGVDSDRLVPVDNPKRNIILWAGQISRWAKNYELWQEIQKQPAPDGYRYMTLSNFPVEDYWEILKKTAVVVCTSRYESFCSCAFEAMSCGVPVVWKTNLQSGIFEDAGIRCDENAKSFNGAIQCAVDNLAEEQRMARQYVLDHCTLRHMRDSYAAVFNEVLEVK